MLSVDPRLHFLRIPSLTTLVIAPREYQLLDLSWPSLSCPLHADFTNVLVISKLVICTFATHQVLVWLRVVSLGLFSQNRLSAEHLHLSSMVILSLFSGYKLIRLAISFSINNAKYKMQI